MQCYAKLCEVIRTVWGLSTEPDRPQLLQVALFNNHRAVASLPTHLMRAYFRQMAHGIILRATNNQHIETTPVAVLFSADW